MKKRILKYLGITLGVFLLLLIYLSKQIEFESRFAHILYAENKILSAQVSEDQQWRIQCEGDLPEKLATTLKLFEDQYFDYHFGINPVSILKAIRDNRKAGRTVRGGSTITMQLARIHEGNRPRTYKQKIKEMCLALAIELKYSKKEILYLYAQHAPYGGNTVGYCSAARRYYDKQATELSWTESATLSVLPNAPSKIYPGKAQQELIRKRNFLLRKLLSNAYIDSITYRLSVMEDLPTQSHHFESMASHLLQKAKQDSPDDFNHHTTLDHTLQQNTKRILQQYRDQYAAGAGVDNICAIILRNDGSIASYVANVTCDHDCGADVDILRSPRSPGSTLKPFLYGVAIDAGLISPSSLLEDIPVFYNGYTPSNFDKKHRGIITAASALTQSLNIPAVDLLRAYGTHPFLSDLKDMGFTTMKKEADHYGLTMILGGGEVTPVELATTYMNIMRQASNKRPTTIDYRKKRKPEHSAYFPMSTGASYLVMDMLKGVHRPQSENGWQYFQNQEEISWKTGTSFGFRDAWSVGCTAGYTVLVWVGNADGEGRPGLTGIKKAAPILFELFKLLPQEKELLPPSSELDIKYVCKASGYLPNASCELKIGQMHPRAAHNLRVCSYHQSVTLDKTEKMQVYQHCEAEVVSKSLFVLNPIVDHYHQKMTGHSYALPPYKKDCGHKKENLRILYPTQQAEILLPRDLNNKKQSLVGKVVTGSKVDSLYWFMDHELVSVTRRSHEVAFSLEPGPHVLTVVGSDGQETSHEFFISE